MLFITSTMPMATIPVKMTPVPMDFVKSEMLKGYISLIDDNALATVLTTLIGMQVPTTQMTGVNPRVGEDTIIIVQSNVQIPKDAKVLPQGTVINFAMVKADSSLTLPIPSAKESVGLLRKAFKALI